MASEVERFVRQSKTHAALLDAENRVLALEESLSAARARIVALTDCVEKARDTFADMAKAAEALKRDVWQAACEVAQEGYERALASDKEADDATGR